MVEDGNRNEWERKHGSDNFYF